MFAITLLTLFLTGATSVHGSCWKDLKCEASLSYHHLYSLLTLTQFEDLGTGMEITEDNANCSLHIDKFSSLGEPILAVTIFNGEGAASIAAANAIRADTRALSAFTGWIRNRFLSDATAILPPVESSTSFLNPIFQASKTS